MYMTSKFSYQQQHIATVLQSDIPDYTNCLTCP